MASLSVAIVDSIEQSLRAVREIVEGMDDMTVVAQAEDLPTGHELIRQVGPMIVILDLDASVDQALAIAEKIGETMPQTAVLATSQSRDPDLILRAMHAGAREYLRRPIDPAELTAALRRTREKMLQQRLARPSTEGQIVTVFSNKGGLGTTTIATNLAVILAEVTHKSVVLVDLDFQMGDVTMFLDLQPAHTIFDVSQNVARADAVFLKSSLAQHASGVYVLAEPYEVEASELITANQVGQILSMLKSMFDFVIIDTSHNFSEHTMTALDASDVIFLVLMFNLPAIRNTQRCLDLFRRLHYDRDKVKLIVNRSGTATDITIQDVEETLDYLVYWQVPNDYTSVSLAINQGVSLSALNPHSKVAVSIKELACYFGLGSVDDEQDRGGPAKGEKQSIFSRLLPRRR